MLKGDGAWMGKTISLSIQRHPLWREEPGLAPGRRVLSLARDAQGSWRLLGGFVPEALPALRCFLGILSDADESSRVARAAALARDFAAACPGAAWEGKPDREFSAVLGGLRDPASLPAVERVFPALPAGSQRAAVRWLRETGDVRAVPSLVRALDSPDAGVRFDALWALRCAFPGAPGVEEAFAARWRTGFSDVRVEAVEYLARRRASKELERARRPPTFYMKAKKAFQGGPSAAAKRYCAQVVGFEEELGDSSRLELARCAATVFDRHERERYLPVLASFLDLKASQGDWVEAGMAAELARSIRHPSMIQPLLSFLGRDGPVAGQEPRLRAALALRSYGPQARAEAARQLLARLDRSRKEGYDALDRFWPMVALVWVGSAADLRAMRSGFERAGSPADFRRLAQTLQPVSAIKDEGAFWTEVVARRNDLPVGAVEWALLRLGDLQDARAVPALVELLADTAPGGEGPVFGALARMGQPGLERLRAAAETDPARRDGALEALCAQDPGGALLLARRLVKEKPEQVPRAGWDCIGERGSVEDIAFLAPYADYWRTGREKSAWPRGALFRLRERLGYDLRGPVGNPSGRLTRDPLTRTQCRTKICTQ